MHTMKGLALFASVMVACAAEVPQADETNDKRVGALQDSLGRELTPFLAQTVQDNPNPGPDLLARVQVSDDELVDFLEMTPGLIALRGSGQPMASIQSQLFPAENKRAPFRVRITNAWRIAAGDAPMPQALEEAIRRSETRGPRPARTAGAITNVDPMKATASFEDREPPRVQVEPGVAVTQQAVDRTVLDRGQPWPGYCKPGGYWSMGGEGYFNANYRIEYAESWAWYFHECPSVDSQEVIWPKCWDWVTNNCSYSHSDIWVGQSNLCTAEGETIHVFSGDESWIKAGSYLVKTNWLSWVHWEDDCAGDWFDDCVQIRVKVNDAIGKRYHFRYIVHEEGSSSPL